MARISLDLPSREQVVAQLVRRQVRHDAREVDEPCRTGHAGGIRHVVGGLPVESHEVRVVEPVHEVADRLDPFERVEDGRLVLHVEPAPLHGIGPGVCRRRTPVGGWPRRRGHAGAARARDGSRRSRWRRRRPPSSTDVSGRRQHDALYRRGQHPAVAQLHGAPPARHTDASLCAATPPYPRPHVVVLAAGHALQQRRLQVPAACCPCRTAPRAQKPYAAGGGRHTASGCRAQVGEPAGESSSNAE